MRYEEPDGKNRWDAPLFHVPLIIKQASENAVLGEEKEINKELEDIETMNNLNNKSAGDSGGHSTNQNKSSTAEEVLFQEVHDSLYLRKCPKPHLSTVPVRVDFNIFTFEIIQLLNLVQNKKFQNEVLSFFQTFYSLLN